MFNEVLYNTVWAYHNKTVPFTKEEFDMVASRASVIKIKKGEFVYRQDTLPVYGGFVVEGGLRHYRALKTERREITTAFQFENSCFSDLRSIFFNEPARTSLVAMEDSVLVRLDKSHYLHLFENCKPFSKLMVLSLEKRYNELVDEVVERVDQEAEQRYLNMLTVYPQILQRASQRHIASYLGIKPQSLSRIRKNIC